MVSEFGYAADANGAAERLNAVGLVGMGGGQQYSGCGGGSVQWLVVGGSVTVAVVGGSGGKWLWLEAARKGGCVVISCVFGYPVHCCEE